MWFLLAISVTVIWGFSELYYKKSTQGDSSLAIFFWQYLFLGVFFISMSLILNMDLLINFKFDLLIKILPIALLAWSAMLFYINAIKNGKLSIVSPLMASNYVLSIILGIIFFSEKVGMLQAVSIIMIAISIILLIRCKNIDVNLVVNSKKSTIGNVFALAYFTAMGVNGFTEKLFLNNFSTIEYFFYYGILCLFMILILFIITKLLKRNIKFTIPKKETAWAIFYSVLGNVFYLFALSIGNIALVLPIMSSYTFVTEILSAAILKEKLSIKQKVYIGLIILGIIMINI